MTNVSCSTPDPHDDDESQQPQAQISFSYNDTTTNQQQSGMLHNGPCQVLQTGQAFDILSGHTSLISTASGSSSTLHVTTTAGPGMLPNDWIKKILDNSPYPRYLTDYSHLPMQTGDDWHVTMTPPCSCRWPLAYNQPPASEEQRITYVYVNNGWHSTECAIVRLDTLIASDLVSEGERSVTVLEQRLHEHDEAGPVLMEPGWPHLNLTFTTE